MQNVLSKKICLSERQSPKGHYWWVFQCFMKVWDKSAEQIPSITKWDWCIFVCRCPQESWGRTLMGRTTTVELLLKDRSSNQRSAHSVALYHIQIYWEKSIVLEKIQRRLWETQSCCYSLQSLQRSVPISVALVWALPGLGRCMAPAQKHSK